MKPCTPSALLLNALRQRVLNLSKKCLKPLLVVRKQLSNEEQFLGVAWSVRKRVRVAAWPWAALLLLAGVHSAQAQTTFTYNAGVSQTYTIPAGASGVKIEASGGGGGGGGSDAGTGKGGDGARGMTAIGSYYALASTVLTVNVGGGGGPGFSSQNSPYRQGDATGSAGAPASNLIAGGAGGRAGAPSWSGGGGAGGGASAVLNSGTVVLIGGGGGGGQGGANNSAGQNGAVGVEGSLPYATSAIGETDTKDGGGGGGAGAGCSSPQAAAGKWHADGTASLVTQSADSGSSCKAASVEGFLLSAAGGAAGAGAPASNQTGAASGATGTVIITPLYPVLSLAKSAPSPALRVGEDSTYTLTVSASGSTRFFRARVVDILPSNLAFVSASGAGWTCTETGGAGSGVVTCDYASAAPVLNAAVALKTQPTTMALVVNRAQVDPSGGNSPSAPGSCTAANTPSAGCAVRADTPLPVRPTITLNKVRTGLSQGTFNLSIAGGNPTGGANPATNVGDGGSTGAVSVNEGATITLAETVATGPALGSYTTSLSCSDGNGAVVATTGSQGSRTITAPGAAAIGAARNVNCTYTNTEIDVLPVTRPVLSCAANGNIFNTAYNGSPTGAPKPSGTDNVWQHGTTFGSTPPAAWTAATVSTFAWGVSNTNGAGWISTQANGNHPGANVDMWFRYVFDLNSNVNPALFRLLMDVNADNSVRGIFVNGVLQVVANVPDIDPFAADYYSGAKTLRLDLTNNWQTGSNVLVLRVSSGGQPLGLRVKSTRSAVCDTKVSVSKVTQGGIGGPFTITGLAPNANGFAGQDLTTTVAGTAVSAPTQTLTTPGALVDLQEDSPTGGYVLSGVSCTGMGAGGTATPNLTNAAVGGIPARSVRLDAAATAAGSSIACTFTNRRPTITFAKELGGNRAVAADQFTVAIRTGGVAGTVVSSTANSTTLGTDASVTAGSGTTGAYFAAAGTAYTLTEAGASGATLANYNGLLSCVDTAGVQTTGLPTAAAFNPALGYAITPVAGAALSCTLTNTPAVRLSLQKALSGLGRVAASDQFTVAIRTGGAGGTVVNATTNSTTTGSGVNVAANTGTTGGFVGVPGTAYTFTEAMAPGSASTLAKYGQTLSCTNAGGTTNVSGWSSLPQTVTPVAGDNIACTVTNAPAALAVTGRVFLDHGLGGGTANDGVLNGGEVGQAGVTVRLTNCAATVYASSVTDGTGAYVFSVPGALSVGAALCVEQTNLSGRVSTGASVGSVALPTGSATAVSGTTYTYTRASTPDRIAFTWNGSGHAGLNFGDVNAGTFGANGSKTGQPGSTLVYAHTFTAGTAGTVGFEVSGAVASPSLSGWTEKIFADVGCTGTLQAGAAQLFPPAAAPQAVLPGQQVCVIVQELIPNTALSGYSNDAAVQANFTYTNANPALPTASYTLHDITNVGDSALELKKEVRNVTQGVLVFGINNQAKTGETLEYRITYTNNAPTPINNLVVSDATPVYTSFVSATAGATPASLSPCVKNTPVNPSPAPAVTCDTLQVGSGTGPVSWRFTGVLNPGGTGDVLFQVKVD